MNQIFYSFYIISVFLLIVLPGEEINSIETQEAKMMEATLIVILFFAFSASYGKFLMGFVFLYHLLESRSSRQQKSCNFSSFSFQNVKSRDKTIEKLIFKQ